VIVREEVPPRSVNCLRILEVAAVKLVDEPLVRAEVRVGRRLASFR